MALTVLIDRKNDIIMALGEVIISVFLGAFVTRFLTEIDTKRKKRYVASMLYSEIKRIEYTVKPIIKYYENSNITVGSVNIFYDVVLKTHVNWNKFNSLCGENSPYFRFSKDIYLLDENTVRSITNFYNSILQADKEYKIYMDYWDRPANSKEYMIAWNIQDSIVNNLIYASKEASYLLDQLNHK
jgi:hypothetical protein